MSLAPIVFVKPIDAHHSYILVDGEWVATAQTKYIEAVKEAVERQCARSFKTGA